MAFEIESGNEAKMVGMSECKPDYEKQAANQKKKLDTIEKLKDALTEFIKIGDLYSFRNITSLTEMYGGVCIQKMRYEGRYDELLRLIEKNR
ncbi:hypothetical protein KJ807_05965 [Patescibacteria group bacterium]|nr:hypothetical protein [Patescibacteria group bacterium]